MRWTWRTIGGTAALLAALVGPVQGQEIEAEADGVDATTATATATTPATATERPPRKGPMLRHSMDR